LAKRGVQFGLRAIWTPQVATFHADSHRQGDIPMNEPVPPADVIAGIAEHLDLS